MAKLFTDDELKTIHSAAQGVWNDIGYDIFQAIAENEEQDINSVSISRSDVLELVCDASRLEKKLPKDLRARWVALDYKAHLRLLKPAFAYTRYGM